LGAGRKVCGCPAIDLISHEKKIIRRYHQCALGYEAQR
jgi:hypothetical protein